MLAAHTNYALAFAMSSAVALLLLLPGLGWNGIVAPSRRLRSAFIPLPGLVLLAAAGLSIWVRHPPRLAVVAVLIVAVNAVMAGAIVGRWRRGLRLADLFGEQGPEAFAIWGCVVATAMAIGLNPLPVAQELQSGTSLPARMVASPNDHLIPYSTAVYVLHGKDGRQSSDAYFGPAWSVASRGPLVPLAITSLLDIFRETPSDPPYFGAPSWPVTRQGAYLARIFGWLTNGMVVLGVGHLLTVIGVPPRRRRIGLVWAALAPVTLINTVFLWPKLLSGFFVLLSTAAVVESAPVAAGLLIVLAWLSHPVGALFVPAIGGLLVWRSAQGGSSGSAKLRAVARSSALFGTALLAAALPWLAFKIHLGAHDMFLDYLLADGDVPNRATSFGSWLDLRLDNARYTLLPGDYVLSGMMTEWVEGPLSDALRWTVQYAKTLPGELGFSLFWLAYAALLLPAEASLRALKWIGIVGTFLIMLIVWGYSGDGLGRNCLEPLVYLLIVLSVVRIEIKPTIWCLLLTGVFLEGRWIEFSGFLGRTGFEWSQVPAASVLAWIAGSGAQLSVLAWFWRSCNAAPTRALPTGTAMATGLPGAGTVSLDAAAPT